MEALVGDLEHLGAPVEVSLGTGVRKITELLELRIENVNFSGLSIFRSAVKHFEGRTSNPKRYGDSPGA